MIVIRAYENILKTSENRLPQRAYYIPSGKSEYTLLNGEWRFAFFTRDIDAPEVIESRINKAEFELGFAEKFDVVVINDELEKAKVDALETIQNFLNA